MASCAQVDSLLQAYIDEELPASERIIFEQHLHECADCLRSLQTQRAMNAMMFESFRDHRLQEDLRAKVLAHLPEMEAVSRPSRIWQHDQPTGMRRILNLMPVFVPAVLLVIGLALFYAWPQDQPGRAVGMVMQLQGKATQAQPAGGVYGSAANESLVFATDSFTTGANSRLMLALAGPSTLKIAENSLLHVESDRRVRLEEGTAWFNVSKDSRLFRVITPAGEVKVFGTTFNVVAKGTSMVVTVVEGTVQVENLNAFVALHAGEQVELTADQTVLTARDVDTDAAVLWANNFEASANAEALFTKIIPPRPSQVLRAEQAFVVLPDRQDISDIHAISLFWKPDPYASGHCSYTVYIADEQMRSLLIKKIDSSVFADKSHNSYQFTLAEHELIRDISVLHIKMVPDTSNGRIETAFTKIEALGS